ncbi:MAG TPA: hypothetical protein VFS10_00355 [Pyrinomonadaceae bacterium]|nr:hypothetical protein [Pyrinomonadaceae bacterium]
MGNMEKIITALAPVFAAGFAVQQLLEIVTSFLDLGNNEVFQKFKKPILGAVAFGLGCALSSQLNIGVLQILKDGTTSAPVSTTDFLATALIISAGTEGVNSILKFLKYIKEDKKREAAAADPQSTGGGVAAPGVAGDAPATIALPAPTEAALTRINRQ